MAKLIAIAVVEYDGRFLVGQRPAGMVLAGLAEFPGGKVEPGETPAAAAIRECLEETGLVVEITGEYSQQVEAYAHDTVQLHFFACQPVEPTTPPQAPFRWIPRAALATLEFPSGNRFLIEQLTSP